MKKKIRILKNNHPTHWKEMFSLGLQVSFLVTVIIYNLVRYNICWNSTVNVPTIKETKKRKEPRNRQHTHTHTHKHTERTLFYSNSNLLPNLTARFIQNRKRTLQTKTDFPVHFPFYNNKTLSSRVVLQTTPRPFLKESDDYFFPVNKQQQC